MLKATILLDDIFNPEKGWMFASHQVPLNRGAANDGNPYYWVTVDGIDVLVFEQRTWQEGVKSNVPATRLVVKSCITGVTITNPSALLSGTSTNNGLPSYGLSGDGDVIVQVAFPFAENFPLEWIRKQLMVCIGLVAEETQDLIRAWNAPGDTVNQSTGFDWGVARNVASVAGFFLSAFLEE